MASRGPGTGLGWAAMLAVALAACGSDPVDEPRRRGQATTAKVAASPAAAMRPVVKPIQPPTPATPSPSAIPANEAASASPSPGINYPPRDECAALPGFPAFRTALRGAVRKRDALALAALADPAINLDFGGGSGPDELRKRLADNPALWVELAELEGLGCAEDGGVVTMPWIFSRLPDSVDAYAALLVTGQGVTVRARPAANAAELAKLDWALVEAVEGTEAAATRPAGFREIVTGPKASPTRGFVDTARLRSVLDYRLIADRQNGEWKLTAFVAGD